MAAPRGNPKYIIGKDSNLHPILEVKFDGQLSNTFRPIMEVFEMFKDNPKHRRKREIIVHHLLRTFLSTALKMIVLKVGNRNPSLAYLNPL